MKPIVASFASGIHGESYYKHIYDIFKKHFGKANVSLEFTPIITTLDEARRIGDKYRGSLPILIALTGGTSRLMKEFTTAGDYSRVILIGHGDHNSLPSVIAARSRLDIEGVWSWIYHCKRPDSPECSAVIDEAVKVAAAVSKLIGSRILLISETSEKTDEVEDFENKFEANVDVLTINQVLSRLGEADEKLMRHFYEVVEKYEFNAPRDMLEHVARLYAILKSIVEENGYAGIAVDCFIYLLKYKITPCLALAVLNGDGVATACEADLGSLALMIISRELTGYTGWIANTSVFRGNRIYLSHCTIAYNMIMSGKVLTHFESGYPYGLSGRLPPVTYTIASMSRDYSTIAIDTGRVTSSGLLYDSMCRTQAIFEVDYNTEEIPLYAPANHHLLIPGDVRNLLKALASLLGSDYFEYRELFEK